MDAHGDEHEHEHENKRRITSTRRRCTTHKTAMIQMTRHTTAVGAWIRCTCKPFLGAPSPFRIDVATCVSHSEVMQKMFSVNDLSKLEAARVAAGERAAHSGVMDLRRAGT